MIDRMVSVAFLLLLVPRMVFAAPAGDSLPAAHVADTTLASITTDTGDFAPGPRSYARYLDPRWCLLTTQHTLDRLQRTLVAQGALTAVQDTPARDTLPMGVVHVAEACNAHLATSDTAAPGHYRRARLALALATGNDSLAQTVLDQLVAGVPVPALRIQVLLESVHLLLTAKPPRVAIAQSIAARIDTSTTAGAGDRLDVHQQLLRFAALHGDAVLLRREAEAVITVTRAMTPNEFAHLYRGESGAYTGLQTFWNAYTVLRNLVYIGHPDSVTVIAHRVQQAYADPHFREMVAAACHMVFSKLDRARCGTMATVSVDSVVHLLAPVWEPVPAQPAPPVRADYWFPVPGQDTTQSTHGVVTLVTHFSPACLNNFDWCRPDEDAIRHLASRYGPKRVAFVMIVSAPHYTVMDAPASPAAVAESYRWYLQDYLKLPVAVAVRNLQVALTLPTPDGRIVYGGTTYHDLYDTRETILTDGRGRVVFQSPGVERFDAHIQAIFPKVFDGLSLNHIVAMAVDASHPGAVLGAASDSSHR